MSCSLALLANGGSSRAFALSLESSLMTLDPLPKKLGYGQIVSTATVVSLRNKAIEHCQAL
jgi:hypothetical protein